MAAPTRASRLRWRCRRGMKELDLLLGRFIDRHGEELTRGAHPELETLLEMEDDMLWDWLQRPTAPAAAAFRDLLELIRRDAS